MEGQIQVNSGDVSIVAVNLDGNSQDNIPSKEDNVYFESADCTNDAEGYWDRSNWEFRIRKLTQTKTKCTLNFLTGEEPDVGTEAKNKIQDLINDGIYADQIIYEQEGEDNNIRFIGPDPDNYVRFNGETWRIIGLMDNVETTS